MIITIDGPSASGKSTVAKLLAQQLGFYYLNTGFLYRALAFLLQEKYGATQHDLIAPKEEVLQQLLAPVRLDYNYEYKQGAQIIFDGTNITNYLKTPGVSQAASILSKNARVRQLLLNVQRQLAHDHNVVVEGRDTGSVVFPNADYKFFLTASNKERARRWVADQAHKGVFLSLKEAENELSIRDKRDRKREIAPLIVPSDARCIDATVMSINDVINLIAKRVERS